MKNQRSASEAVKFHSIENFEVGFDRNMLNKCQQLRVFEILKSIDF